MRATVGTCGQGRPSALEGVLDLLAGLLDVGAGLVTATLGLELLVVGRLAGGFLRLALELVGLVVELVVETHRRSSCAEGGVSSVRTGGPASNLPRRWAHTTPVRVDRTSGWSGPPGVASHDLEGGQDDGSDAGEPSALPS